MPCFYHQTHNSVEIFHISAVLYGLDASIEEESEILETGNQVDLSRNSQTDPDSERDVVMTDGELEENNSLNIDEVETNIDVEDE